MLKVSNYERINTMNIRLNAAELQNYSTQRLKSWWDSIYWLNTRRALDPWKFDSDEGTACFKDKRIFICL